MTHRIHPSNTSELLSVEQYHILSQELVLKVVLRLLVAPPVAPPLRAHGAAPSFAAHQSSRAHERHGVAESYSLFLESTYLLSFNSWQNLAKQTFLSVFFFKKKILYGSCLLLRQMFKWIMRSLSE